MFSVNKCTTTAAATVRSLTVTQYALYSVIQIRGVWDNKDQWLALSLSATCMELIVEWALIELDISDNLKSASENQSEKEFRIFECLTENKEIRS